MGEPHKPKVTDNSIDLVSFESSDAWQMDVQSINAFFGIAQESYSEKKYRLAMIYLRKILQIDNSYLPAYKLLSKVFQMKNQLDKAAEILRQAVDIKFRDAELHYQLGYLYYLQGNETGFVRECTKALVVNPNFSKAFYALALLHYKNKRYKKAKEELTKCLELNPHDSEAHMLMAKTMIRQREFTLARRSLEAVLKHDPKNEKVNYYLGEICFLLKDYSAALQQYLLVGKVNQKTTQRIRSAFDLIKTEIDQKLKKEPRDIDTLMNLASLYYQIERYGDAKNTLQQLLNYYPQYLPALVNYGLMLIYENKFLEGIKFYQKVLQMSPMNKEAKMNQDKANSLAEEYLRNNYQVLEYKKELLEIYMLQEKYDKAVLVMRDLKNSTFAKQILQKVSDKNFPIYRFYQAAILFLLNEIPGAEYILQQLKEPLKTEPAYFFLLGLLEKEKGNLVEAYKNFETTKNINPNYWFIEKEMKEIVSTELQKLEAALLREPNNLKIHLEYIDLLIIMGFYKKALQHIIKIKKSELGVVDFSEQLNRATNLYEGVLEAELETEKPEADLYIDLGEIYIYKKRYSDAFFLFQNAIKQFPGDKEVKEFYNYLINKNIEIYRELAQTKQTTMVFYNLAVFYAAADRRDDSLAMLKVAVEKDKKLAIQARYEETFKKYRLLDKFRLITLIEGEDKNIYQMQD